MPRDTSHRLAFILGCFSSRLPGAWSPLPFIPADLEVVVARSCPSVLPPTPTLTVSTDPGSPMKPMNEQEMRNVVSGIRSSWDHANPSACISVLNPLLSTARGRKFLSEQEGENAIVLIELFDWVTISLNSCRFTTRAENVVFQSLSSRGIPLDKGCVLWTLRQLCACQGILPKSCVLQVEFKPTTPYHAAGGFADVWKGSHNGVEVAFKSIRGSTQTGDTVSLARKVR